MNIRWLLLLESEASKMGINILLIHFEQGVEAPFIDL